MNLEQIAKDLQAIRQDAQYWKDEKARLLSVVTESAEYRKIEANYRDCVASEETASQALRTAALEKYFLDQQKQVGFGIEVKIFTKAEIVNESSMREWCLRNFTPALKLDTKAVEKAAIAGSIPPELVTITTEPKVMIPQDLSKHLDSGNEKA